VNRPIWTATRTRFYSFQPPTSTLSSQIPNTQHSVILVIYYTLLCWSRDHFVYLTRIAKTVRWWRSNCYRGDHWSAISQRQPSFLLLLQELCHLATNFHNFWHTHTHQRKFATGGYIPSPPNTVCVTTLLCRTLITTSFCVHFYALFQKVALLLW